MVGGGSTASSLSLEQTPTWAVAAICLLFIAVSFLLENLISSLGNWLRKKRKKALSEALEKIKSELMLLGFLSLLLAVAQLPLSHICVPADVADKMLPCEKTYATKKLPQNAHYRNSLLTGNDSSYGHDNGIPNYAPYAEQKSGNSTQASDPCSENGLVTLISQEAIHQLHLFIFALAVMHVTYTILTMALGRAKIRRWKHWEKETQTTHYQVSNDPQRFRFLRETTFGRRHMSSWSRATALLWIKCFFRQFYSSVEKVDYLTLRHAFISTHLPTNSYFNFHEYIKRSLDNDFKAIVGISPILWLLLVLFLLLNVHGLSLYFWLSFVPLVIVLVVGAKLQVIVAQMALRLQEEKSVIMGTPLVQPTNELFWFGRPQLVLFLIHLTLFQNAFELTFFIWITFQFGLKSCYHENFEIIVVRVVLALVVQFVCSYVTLPLYALVTQMGSHFKESIFNEQTMNALRRWLRDVREKKKQTPGTADNSPPLATTL
ncbi:MLO-like protein 12 [Nymphaea colorata]|nr:MLO-like protein 12 [Nymphaea colorata]